jgi:ribonucleoside-diphosphate reductase alpha chain
VLSSFDFMSSTPTLFNSGTRHSQLSSCYLTTVSDDLDGIYEAIKENALLSKFAGGLGNDWTPVRALGSHIKGTNGKSQGVVPFLKVVNDTAVAVNQGGKRKGAVCAYLETWHLDIEEFLELRKNTGDDRRRTHDMNTANWIPDLFMKRVMEDGDWTLFSPNEVPDLHDKVGRAFEQAYLRYEDKAARGEIKSSRSVPAQDAVAQDAVDAVRDRPSLDHLQGRLQPALARSSTWAWCTAPTCAPRSRSTPPTRDRGLQPGLGQPAAHMKRRRARLDRQAAEDVRTAMRMLDNVIDINYYAVPQGAQLQPAPPPGGPRHHGLPGLPAHDAHPYAPRRRWSSPTAQHGAVCYYAYWASTELAEERGRYSELQGLLWDRGILPQDSPELLAEERGGYVDVDMSSTLDWDALRGRSSSTACATPTAWRSRPPRPSPTSSACRLHRADLPEPVREIEPVGRVHGGQRATWCAT